MRCILVVLVSVYLTTFIVVCEESTTGSQTASDGSSTEKSSLEKSLSHVYTMTQNFLNLVVKDDFLDANSKGAITYEDIERIISDGKYSELQDRWQDLVKVWGPLAACMIIGLLFVIFMPIAGCCFCCCFCCCKRCGKASSSEDPPNAKCKRMSFCTILFILTTLMMTGAIVAAVSNEILHQKLENVDNQGPIGKISNSLNSLESLALTTVNDIVRTADVTLASTVNGVIQSIDGSVQNAVDAASNLVNADPLLTQSEKLGNDATTSLNNLKTVAETLSNLNSLNVGIKQTLDEIKTNISTTCSSCPVDSLKLTTDFTTLSNLSHIADKVNEVQTITDKAQTAKQEFDKVKTKVNDTIHSQITDAKTQAETIKIDVGKDISKVNETVYPIVQRINENINPEVEKVDGYLKKYGDYWWYGGIVVPCFILLSVLCYYLGILFGLFGDRPGPGAQCCNKGAGSNFLVCGVLCSYLFAAILMFIVILLFMIGGLMYTSVCRDLNKGVENVEKLETVLDKTADLSLKKTIYPNKPHINITIGGMLAECKENKALYTALQLHYIFDVDKLLNVSSVTSELDRVLDQSFTINAIDIIPAGLEAELKKFSGSGITDINYTSFDEQINKYNLSAAIDDIISTLNGLPGQNKTALQREIDALNSLKMGQVAQFEANLTSLNASLRSLESFKTLVNTTNDLISGLKKAETDFNTNATNIVKSALTDVVKNTTNFIQKQLNDIRDKIKTKIGQCEKLYSAAQSISDAICVVILDPLNTFWFGLGWGLFFFIPCIIFALCLANLYQRQEKYDDSRPRPPKKSKKQPYDQGDMEMYQGVSGGGGIDAYHNNHDNAPLYQRDAYKSGGGGGGIHNAGYDDPHRRGNPPDYRNGGQRGYEYPPSYEQSGGHQLSGGYPVLPQNRY